MTPTRRSFVDTALVFSTAFAAFTGAMAESHTVSFVNNCGHGTPMLIQGPKTLSTGSPFTSSGPLSSAIAYLQTGACQFNGEGCTLAEMTLNNPNPSIPGSGSSVDISLIAPHKFSVPTSFSYTNGCNGVGAACNDANCKMAFRNPNDNQVQVACQANNVNLVITFCNGQAAPPASPPPAATTKKPATTPAPPANTPAPAPPANTHKSTPPANTHAPPANTPAPAPANVAPPASQSPKAAPTSTPARPATCHAKRRRHTRSGNL